MAAPDTEHMPALDQAWCFLACLDTRYALAEEHSEWKLGSGEGRSGAKKKVGEDEEEPSVPAGPKDTSLTSF